jgi:hypothetical protein
MSTRVNPVTVVRITGVIVNVQQRMLEEWREILNDVIGDRSAPTAGEGAARPAGDRQPEQWSLWSWVTMTTLAVASKPAQFDDVTVVTRPRSRSTMPTYQLQVGGRRLSAEWIGRPAPSSESSLTTDSFSACFDDVPLTRDFAESGQHIIYVSCRTAISCRNRHMRRRRSASAITGGWCT